MKKILLIVIIISFQLLAQNKINVNHKYQELKCSTCHTCEIPTKEKPCLIDCPRDKMITIEHKAEEGPVVLTIDRLKKQTDIYKPVIFTHRLHAEMSDMAGGCKMCHHYNPPGKVIGCKECHEIDRNRIDISKPDLKGAYHQQCMNCHRQWSGKVECLSCHDLNANQKKSEKQKEIDATKKVHKKVEPPKIIKFETPKSSSKFVEFLHEEHFNLFSIECQKCHSNESCNKCHYKFKPVPASQKSTLEKHTKCSNCHDTKSNCTMCHSNNAKNAFNHLERTGFDINKFHSKLTCQRCHVEKGKFIGLNSDCSTCHGIWTKDNFKHSLVGLQLDETHLEFDCTECHQNKKFEKPTCKNCHDDKEFPKDKPGKLVK
ncbi:cytochrome c3 family protein [Stygiobacter electus]|uniref:Cytochrome c3 family protein n=1 Tax=Stygiobacter electus TaxID=3032292 RepID=A0AAE3TCA9_9BACT|nr:cytochrome c3 family protein [Stygiobacter electus]MDF1611715.1 cytochrome c3 family protein [Stygiobacter electus]